MKERALDTTLYHNVDINYSIAKSKIIEHNNFIITNTFVGLFWIHISESPWLGARYFAAANS